jgi:hypothetical protein
VRPGRDADPSPPVKKWSRAILLLSLKTFVTYERVKPTQDRLHSYGHHAGLPNVTEGSAYTQQPTKSQVTERILMEGGIDDAWGFPILPTVNSPPSALFATIVPHISGRRLSLRYRHWRSCEQHG